MNMKTICSVKSSAVLISAFVAFSLCGVAQAQPNVLFISVDDLKPTLGCYDDNVAITPNIDTLAESGLVFFNAHCQLAYCGPSRASLTTSLMPEETGVTSFVALRCPDRLPDVITLPQHFKNEGYVTAAVGKIHDYRTVGDINPSNPCGQTLNGGVIDDVLSWSDYDNGGSGIGSSSAISASNPSVTLKQITESVDAPDSDFVDGSICDRGIAKLNELAEDYKTSGDPFFLGVGFKKPHMPFLAPQTYFDYYVRDDFEIHPFQWEPHNGLSYTFNTIYELRNTYYMHLNAESKAISIPFIIPEDDQKTLLHGYYASTSFIDAQVGRLLDALEAAEIAEDTIIVFWGDHGFHLGDHNEWGKHTNMEQATRSPLIISVPNFGAKGRKTITPVTFLDIYPTLCELAGLPIPEQPLSNTQLTGRPLRGKSLVPVLADPDSSVRFGATIHYGTFYYGYAYRTERYRYVEWINKNTGVLVGHELYDYKYDPYETENIAPMPGYGILVQQLSNSMRGDGESNGAERLKSTSALTVDPGSIALSFAQEEFASLVLNENGGNDTSDAQFSALVDFDIFDDSASSVVQTVLDIGGGGGEEGLSLVYGPGNELIVTICGNWTTRTTASYVLSSEQILAGMLEVTIIVDIDHAAGDGTEDMIQLFIDRIPVASSTIYIPDNDFINGDKSGFGMTGGNATGGWQTTPARADFISGKINYSAGFWYSDNITGIETSERTLANLNGIASVNLEDFSLLTVNWLEKDVGLQGDIKKDGAVDIYDLEVMASVWLLED
ncbi:MAG: sulfatase [Planctomycetes bacterium]|nr:sulfatase [Planctomycetota bacterium]